VNVRPTAYCREALRYAALAPWKSVLGVDHFAFGAVLFCAHEVRCIAGG